MNITKIKLLAASLLIFTAICCGPKTRINGDGLSEQERQRLKTIGDLPFNEIQDKKDKEFVANALMKVVKNFDYVGYSTVFGSIKNKIFKLPDCQVKMTKFQNDINRAFENEHSALEKRIDNKKEAILGYFERINIYTFSQCAKNVGAVYDQLISKMCTINDETTGEVVFKDAVKKFGDNGATPEQCWEMTKNYGNYFIISIMSPPTSEQGQGGQKGQLPLSDSTYNGQPLYGYGQENKGSYWNNASYSEQGNTQKGPPSDIDFEQVFSGMGKQLSEEQTKELLKGLNLEHALQGKQLSKEEIQKLGAALVKYQGGQGN